MTDPRRRAWRWSLVGISLLWALFGLLWAQVIALPKPFLPPLFLAELLGDIPSATTTERFVVMIFKETSLLLLAFALVGLLLAAAAYGTGARVGPLVAALLCAVSVTTSLAPTAEARSVAVAEDIRLSLPGYFAEVPTAGRPPETETYARSKGGDLKLDVWRPDAAGGAPAAEGGRPAIIVVHGGGWRSGARGEFPDWNAWLSDEGYVVFDIDYRLAPPPSWQDAPGDVRCAVAWVKENSDRYGVDPERVALMGRSAGGHLALLAAYSEGTSSPTAGCGAQEERGDTTVAAVAAFYPPTDLARLSSMGYLGGVDRFLGGTSRALPGRYRHSSPVARVGPDDPPTFLVHGGDDEIVPPGESELLAGRLREVGVPHRYVKLPWANHTFDFIWGGWGGQITRSSLEEFLDSNLKVQGNRPDQARGPDQATDDRPRLARTFPDTDS